MTQGVSPIQCGVPNAAMVWRWRLNDDFTAGNRGAFPLGGVQSRITAGCFEEDGRPRRRKRSGGRRAVIAIALLPCTVSLFAQGANAVLAAGSDSSTGFRVPAVKYC